jgi:hypothetical protein
LPAILALVLILKFAAPKAARIVRDLSQPLFGREFLFAVALGRRLRSLFGGLFPLLVAHRGVTFACSLAT